MKICNHCQTENLDENIFCTDCGLPLEEPAEETTEETAAEAAAVETEEEEEFPLEAPEQTEKTKKFPVGLIVVIVLAVLLVVAVIYGKGQYDKKKAEEAAQLAAEQAAEQAEQEEEGAAADILAQLNREGHHVNAHGYNSHSIHYTVDEAGVYAFDYQDADGSIVSVPEADVEAMLGETVATAAGETLTSRELMYYYDEEYYSFYTNYQSYIAYLLDPSKPLDEQPSLSSATTWQQEFINAGVNMFHEVSALCAEAEAAGFTMPAEDEAMVASMLTQLEDVAVSYGYDSPDAYLKEYYGPAASLDVYLKFFEKSYYANLYISSLAAAMEVSEQELVDYYTANSETLMNSYGLEMNDQPMVNVRHILITPESTTAEDGTSSISDEAWAAAKAEADSILAQWQSGDASEDTFAALAEEHTDDPGSATTGGLYENVYPGQMVAEFNDWCFDVNRQPGDTAIVQTTYGYHIMYFSSFGEEIYWRSVVTDMIISEAITNKIAEIQAAHPLDVDFSKAIMLTTTENTIPEAETEAEVEVTE